MATQNFMFDALDNAKEHAADMDDAWNAINLKPVATGQFTSAIAAYKFMMAGNATVTFVSKKTGQRYTYQIQKPAPKEGQRPKEVYFVKLLSGPDNNSDYTYLGMISHNYFRTTKASKLTLESAPVRAFQWTWDQLTDRQLVPAAVEIWHEGRCGRCGRKLTVPESIAAGIGPECAEKI